jgi:hypothetical protein
MTADRGSFMNRHPVLTSLSAWTLSLGALVFGIVAFHGLNTVSGSTVIQWLGKQVVANNAATTVQGDDLLIQTKEEQPAMLALVSPPLLADNHARLAIEASALPKDVELALLWMRSDESKHIFRHPIDLSHGRPLPLFLDRDPEWRGQIAKLALSIKGPIPTPWRLVRIELTEVDPASILASLVADWTAFEPWEGHSINVVFGGLERQRVYLPLLAFVASVLAVTLLVAWSKRRHRKLAPTFLILPFIIGWLVLDLRWQANLLQQADQTYDLFGGLSWEERHLKMEDGDLFRFVQSARKRLPLQPVRIFAISDFEYFRLRAGYHLYPNNVLAFDWSDPGILRPGDYLLLYQKSDVRFDVTNSQLLWGDGRRVPVAPLATQRGAGLFEVK